MIHFSIIVFIAPTNPHFALFFPFLTIVNNSGHHPYKPKNTHDHDFPRLSLFKVRVSSLSGAQPVSCDPIRGSNDPFTGISQDHLKTQASAL